MGRVDLEAFEVPFEYNEKKKHPNGEAIQAKGRDKGQEGEIHGE